MSNAYRHEAWNKDNNNYSYHHFQIDSAKEIMK